MKDIKSMIIGFLLATCMFMFMGLSEKEIEEKHFETIYAKEIILENNNPELTSYPIYTRILGGQIEIYSGKENSPVSVMNLGGFIATGEGKLSDKNAALNMFGLRVENNHPDQLTMANYNSHGLTLNTNKLNKQTVVSPFGVQTK